MVLGVFICYVCWSVYLLSPTTHDAVCDCGAVLEETGHFESNINMKEGKQ